MRSSMTNKATPAFDALKQYMEDHPDDSIIPGNPTQNYLLCEVSKEQVRVEGNNLITTSVIHKVLAVGPNTEKVKVGDIVQVAIGGRIQLEWGSKRNFLVRENQVEFIFDRDPRKKDENAAENKGSIQFRGSSKS